MVNFMPESYIQKLDFIKYRWFDSQNKPYGSDNMIEAGTTQAPHLFYWNFYLVDEHFTYTRQSYTWLDATAFVGGNVDTILYGALIFFFIYNYGMQRYSVFYSFESQKNRR